MVSLQSNNELHVGSTRLKKRAEGARESVLHWAVSACPRASLHGVASLDFDVDGKEKRRLEHAMGRSLAESLLKESGHRTPENSIGVNEDRSPRWPRGYVGSISHSDNWLWVAVSRSSQLLSIGVDTETVASQSTCIELENEIGTHEEWALMRVLGLPTTTTFTLLFSAKEAFYKCVYPIEKSFFGFRDAEVISVCDRRLRIRKRDSQNIHTDFRPDAYAASSVSELNIEYHIEDTNVFTAAWICTQEIE